MPDKPSDLWNRSANNYAEVFDGQVTQAIEPTLDAAEVSSGSRLLDIGTGPGLIAGAAAARGAEVVGTDFAPNMVEVARKRYPKIAFEVADAADLPFEDASFDAVTMGFTLFMLPDPDKALTEVHRVLRPEGRFAASVWRGLTQGHNLFFSTMTKYIEVELLPGGPPLLNESDPAVWRAVLERAGFSNSSVEELPIIWQLSDAGHLFDAFASMRDLSALTTQQMQSFKADVIASVEALNNRVPFPALILSGVA